MATAVETFVEIKARDQASPELKRLEDKVARSSRRMASETQKAASKWDNFKTSVIGAATAIGLFQIGEQIIGQMVEKLIQLWQETKEARRQLELFSVTTTGVTTPAMKELSKEIQDQAGLLQRDADMLAVLGTRLGEAEGTIRENVKLAKALNEEFGVELPEALIAVDAAQRGMFERLEKAMDLRIRSTEDAVKAQQILKREYIETKLAALEAQQQATLERGRETRFAPFGSLQRYKELQTAIDSYRKRLEQLKDVTLPALDPLEKEHTADIEKTAEAYRKLEEAARKASTTEKSRAGGTTAAQDAIQSARDAVLELEQAALVSGAALGDALGTAIVDSKNAEEAFKEFARTVIRELTAIAAKWIVVGIAKSFGYAAAEGGVVPGQMGRPRSVERYAFGGVARKPQVAIFGEGSGAEAFVPLPDGRTIPVTLNQGAGAGGGNYTIVIQGARDPESMRRFMSQDRALVLSWVAEATQRSPNFRRTIASVR